MRISFLIDDLSCLDNVPQHDGVTREIKQLTSNSRFSIFTCEMKGDSLDAAKDLADIRDLVDGEHARLLDDDPSRRFERRLYNLIATFERGLRKLLTISLCSKDSTLGVELVCRLEKLAFGELFDKLFIDEKFNRDAKDLLVKKGRSYEKRDLLERLGGVPEHSLWSDYFGSDEMPTIAEKHRSIQGYRNDVMHSHRMKKSEYLSAEKLLEKANIELALAIDRALGGEVAEGLAKALLPLLDALDAERERASSQILSVVDSLAKLYGPPGNVASSEDEHGSDASHI